MVTNLSSGVITFLFNLLMMHFAGEALDQEITVLSTDMPVFEAALKIHGMLS